TITASSDSAIGVAADPLCRSEEFVTARSTTAIAPTRGRHYRPRPPGRHRAGRSAGSVRRRCTARLSCGASPPPPRPFTMPDRPLTTLDQLVDGFADQGA